MVYFLIGIMLGILCGGIITTIWWEDCNKHAVKDGYTRIDGKLYRLKKMEKLEDIFFMEDEK